MAQALGYSFKDKTGTELLPVGDSLKDVQSVIPPIGDPLGFNCEFILLSDVQNVLYGQRGAAFVYTQDKKGAAETEIRDLDFLVLGIFQKYGKWIGESCRRLGPQVD